MFGRRVIPVRWCALGRLQLLLCVGVLALFAAEEVNYGTVFKQWHNYYRKPVELPITRQRGVDGNHSLAIAVLVVVNRESELAKYRLAQDSLECYTRHFNYPLFRLVLERDTELANECPQTDFMFRRHCVVAHFLARHPEVQVGVFLDADMGVINPNHLLEDYVPTDVDVLLYERIFDFEVMAGSYIVRNSKFARQFLLSWADYETRLPASFHGTDNAALHQVLVDRFAPGSRRDADCRRLWEASKDWDGVWRFVACARSILRGRLTFERLRILSKTSARRWVRDGWLSNSHWSPRDFLLHGWQMARLDSIDFAGWFNPFAVRPDALGRMFALEKCSSPEASENWRYKDTFVQSDVELSATIQKTVLAVQKKLKRTLKELQPELSPV